MYAEYAKDPRMKLNLGIRRRLAPLLDNGRDEIELMTAILFSLPGSPVLYYGDEIAMGDNVYLGDRDGVRTPMQWTGDRNGGFSRADFAQLYAPPLMDPVYGFQAVNVEAQLRTPTSLLRWLHRFIALRKEHPVFGLGTYEPLETSNPRIFAHIRRYEDDIVLCVHNLARSAQAVELDLSEYAGPLSGRDVRPHALPADRRAALPADARPARLLLVPAGRGRRGGDRMSEPVQSPTQRASPSARRRGAARVGRAAALVRVEVASRRPGSRSSRRVTLRDDPPLVLALVQTRFATGTPRALPAAARVRGRAATALRPRRDRGHRRAGPCYDALADPELARELLRRIDAEDEIETDDGRFSFHRVRRSGRLTADAPVRAMGVEQSNTSIVFDDATRAEGVPQARGRDQPRARDAALPDRARLRATSPRCRAGTSTRAGRSPRRSASSSASSPTRATAGSSRSSSSPRDPERVPRPARRASARSPPRCTPCSPPTPATRTSRPRSRARRRCRC